ncbi:MAG: PAP/fibrillin family protein [Jaaginema sp. PMC 1079.18]|nr:PAP/fibrillin family protein [Jaaginema sp. PMC 1080.18]MEC4853677.1 PAP/fibrillin family protein [Jaaginema sp. PMC 1079.18]MEC4867591.1 PAP/fibrillin family protein [Jaaginema sp. PMC 1078.18]
MTLDEPRATLQQLSQGSNVHQDRLEWAIATLEKQFNAGVTLTDLAGVWRLLWTSGTQNSRKLPFRTANKEIRGSQRDRIIQVIDSEHNCLTNQVCFPIGSLTISGTCHYTSSKRLNFTFSQLSLKLGTLPALDLPFGSWATGWLQTTYLDTEYHIERGDRGGVSLYQKR